MSSQDLTQILTDISHRIAAGDNLVMTLRIILDALHDTTESTSARLVLENAAVLDTLTVGAEHEALANMDLSIHHYCQNLGKLETPDIASPPEGLDLSPLEGVATSVVAFPLKLYGGRKGTLWLVFKTDSDLAALKHDYVKLLKLQAQIAIDNVAVMTEAQATSEQLSALLTNDYEPIVIVDTNHLIQVFNPAAEVVFQTEYVNAHLKPFDTVVSSDELQQMLQAGANAPNDVEYQSHDNRTFSPHVSEVRATDGGLRGWLLVLRDVTRFKNLSENMSDFLRTVSHDIRSPMTAAKGFVDMLTMVGPVNEKQQLFIDKILTSINDMTNLVEKVLDAGRLDPEMDVYEIRREACDPADVIKKAVSTFSTAAENKQITLSANAAPDVPVMYIDSLMTERALLNLVENAIKYTPEGGEVHVTAEVQDDILVLSVKDNGYGIAPEDQARLFERGERVRRKEHKGIRGSGLGLFIVRNVARKHHGYATLDSEVGRGSTFSISIPLLPENMIGGGASQSS